MQEPAYMETLHQNILDENQLNLENISHNNRQLLGTFPEHDFYST